jgi:hypothetical protein
LERCGNINHKSTHFNNAINEILVLEERSVAGGLSEWFDGFDMGPLLTDLSSDGYNGRWQMPEKLGKAIEYAGRLVMAARAIDDVNLVMEVKKAAFLSHLVNLGGAYAALNPSNDSVNSFLQLAWQNSLSNNAENTAMSIEDWLLSDKSLITSTSARFSYLTKILVAIKNTRSSPANAKELDRTLGSIWEYQKAYLKQSNIVNSIDNLNSVWNIEDKFQQVSLNEKMRDYIASVNLGIVPEKDEIVIPLPNNTVQYASGQLVIPIVDIALVITAAGLIVYWQASSKDRKELINLVIDRGTDTVASISQRVESAVRQAGVVSERAVLFIRQPIEDWIQKQFFPINGDNAIGNTVQVAIHLARLLRLSEVGGMPSGEPPDPGDNNDNHWWKEIKGFLKNVATATKGASRKQVLRELRRRFSDGQILEIEARLAEAAAKMGENPPPFIP